MAEVPDFDFSVENIFFEVGGAGDEECEPGCEGTGDCCAVEAGGRLDGPPTLIETVWGGGVGAALGGAENKDLPGTNVDALALSLLMSTRRSAQYFIYLFNRSKLYRLDLVTSFNYI